MGSDVIIKLGDVRLVMGLFKVITELRSVMMARVSMEGNLFCLINDYSA